MNFPRDIFAADTTVAARRGTLCVAPEGDILVPGTPAFHDRLGYRDPDFDLADYAVRNMGYLGLSRVSPSRLKVRFRPALMEGRAVEAACHYLIRCGASEVELNFMIEDWISEVRANDGAAVQRFVELCSAGNAATRAQEYEVKPLELENAARDYANPLKPLFQKWRASFGVFDDSTMGFISRFGFLSRLVLVTAPNATETPRWQYLGPGLRLYDENTMMEMIGQPIDQQPDKKFGEWVSAHYRTMLDSNKPRLDSLQVAVKQAGSGTHHICYDRLMLPWRSAKGGTLISVASVQTGMKIEGAANENATAPDGSHRPPGKPRLTGSHPARSSGQAGRTD